MASLIRENGSCIARRNFEYTKPPVERASAYFYTTIGAASSKFDEFLAKRSQFDDIDHDQIWQAYADRSGNGSYLKKMAQRMAWKGGLIVAILRSETAGSELALDLLNIHR